MSSTFSTWPSRLTLPARLAKSWKNPTSNTLLFSGAARRRAAGDPAEAAASWSGAKAMRIGAVTLRGWPGEELLCGNRVIDVGIEGAKPVKQIHDLNAR